MPREKILRDIGREFHTYSKEELNILARLRNRASYLLQILANNNIQGFVHGSVARGDVSTTSDIDIHIPYPIPSFRLDLSDEFVGNERRIIMGTPNSTIKGLLILDEDCSVSFPLTTPKEREIEFYKFSGLLYLEELKKNEFVSGINKQLLLIEATETGYWYSSVISDVKRVMQLLKISQRIVDERIRVLLRRDEIGRTGKILDYLIPPHENYEQALHKLASKNPIVRNQIKKQKK
jgi:predicted nucleotidyltransferase